MEKICANWWRKERKNKEKCQQRSVSRTRRCRLSHGRRGTAAHRSAHAPDVRHTSLSAQGQRTGCHTAAPARHTRRPYWRNGARALHSAPVKHGERSGVDNIGGIEGCVECKKQGRSVNGLCKREEKMLAMNQSYHWCRVRAGHDFDEECALVVNG